MLAWLFTCAHTHPTLALQLAESRAAALEVERRNTRLLRTVDCLQDWFLGSARDADQLRADVARLRAERDELLVDKEELTSKILWLEGELTDTQRGYEDLKHAVKTEAARKVRKG